MGCRKLRPSSLAVVLCAVPVACADNGADPPPDGPRPDAAVTQDASVVARTCPGPSSGTAGVEAVVDRQARGVLLDLMANAQHCLDVFEFEWLRSGSAADIRNMAVDAARRGVHVRVLLDDEVDANDETADGLRKLGIDARINYSGPRTHLKMVAVDGAAVLIGSTNLSGASLDFNHETNVLVSDPTAVAFLTDYLDAVWADPGHTPASRVSDAPAPVAVWVDGGYSTLALPAIQTASAGIDIIMYGINLDTSRPDGPVERLANALYDAAGRGGTVRVLLERSSWNTGINGVNEHAAEGLRAGGVAVRFDDPDTVTHAKLMIADEQAFVGTNNWGYGGLVRDHEAGVMMDIPNAVADLRAYFEAQWRAAQ